MSLGITITGLHQQTPYTATTATFTVQFAITGDPPDFVQVYASNLGETDPGGLGDLVGVIDFSAPDPSLFCSFTVPAGEVYKVWVCARLGTPDDPDPKPDGVNWDNYCEFQIAVARATPAPEGQRSPPWISNIDPEPANATQPDRITVKWESPQPYDKYLIWWTENGQPKAQGEPGGSGTSGSWTATPTHPGARYTFAVKGGVSGGVLGNYLYSDWSPTLTITAPQHFSSLRKFMVASGINPAAQRLSAVLKAQRSVRAYMKL